MTIIGLCFILAVVCASNGAVIDILSNNPFDGIHKDEGDAMRYSYNLQNNVIDNFLRMQVRRR